jgi:hypothetical protein
MELSRTDLLKLLSVLEGELQSRELVIAVLRSEQTKRLLYPAKLTAKTVNKTQSGESGKSQDAQKSVPSSSSPPSACAASSATTAAVSAGTSGTSEPPEITALCDPLAALFRDSMELLDPGCDELVNKSLINYQSKTLHQLLAKQKAVRTLLLDQLNQVTAKYDVMFHELQGERNKSETFDRNAILSRCSDLQEENSSLKASNEALQKELAEEKDREKKMILSLLNERKQLIIKLIEEKSRNSDLMNQLTSNKVRISEMSEGLEEESKRSLQMESELEKLSAQHLTESVKLKSCLRQSESKNMELLHQIEVLKREVQIAKGLPVSQVTVTSPATILGEGVRSSIVTVPSSNPRPAGIMPITIAVTQAQASVARSASPVRAMAPVSSSSPNITILNSSFSKSNNTGTIVRSSSSKLTTMTTISASGASPASPAATVTVANQSYNLLNAGHSVSEGSARAPATGTAVMTKSAEDLAMVQQSGVVKAQLAKRLSNPGSSPSSSSSPPSSSRGAPPPIPPNKPVLPAQVLKEKSKLIQANFGNQSFRGSLPNNSKQSTTSATTGSGSEGKPVPIKTITRTMSEGPGEITDNSVTDAEKVMKVNHLLDANGNNPVNDEEDVVSMRHESNGLVVVDHFVQELADIQKLLVSISDQ